MNITIQSDVTIEELALLDLVKQNMLRRISDRKKVIFLYCFELGRSSRDAAIILNTHETSISRHIKEIREILTPFKQQE